MKLIITSSVNKTVTENDEIVETERGNSSPSSNSKQKIENQTEPLSNFHLSLITKTRRTSRKS